MDNELLIKRLSRMSQDQLHSEVVSAMSRGFDDYARIATRALVARTEAAQFNRKLGKLARKYQRAA